MVRTSIQPQFLQHTRGVGSKEKTVSCCSIPSSRLKPPGYSTRPVLVTFSATTVDRRVLLSNEGEWVTVVDVTIFGCRNRVMMRPPASAVWDLEVGHLGNNGDPGMNAGGVGIHLGQ